MANQIGKRLRRPRLPIERGQKNSRHLRFERLESRQLLAVYAVPGSYLSHGGGAGIVGSYVDQNLRNVSHDDWRVTQSIAGTRIDPSIHFTASGFGSRSSVGLTGGTDANWDAFSVQWDGFITVPIAGTRLYTRSDDSSRMWIDVNGDSNFSSSPSELVDNNWGGSQGATTSGSSVPLPIGTYAIRIQYEEGGGGNSMVLGWDDSSHSAGLVDSATIISENGSIATIDEVDQITVSLSSGDTINVQPLGRNQNNPAYAPAVELLLPSGEPLSASYDGHSFQVVAPVTGDYTGLISSRFVQRGFTGDYRVQFRSTPFVGTVESEPNDSLPTADFLSPSVSLRGDLLSATDVDLFRFSAAEGQTVVVKLAHLPEENPAVRLLDTNGSLLTAGSDGNGLAFTLDAAGTYYVALDANNTAGPVQGEYAGSLLLINRAVLESNSGDAFDHAPPLQSPTLFLVPEAYLTQSAGGPTGLVGSYINQNLGGRFVQDDWRVSQNISGTRLDPILNFATGTWGSRSEVGLTSGSDSDWNWYAVQWDGYLTVAREGTRVYTRSDDSSRMWIDLNNDGVFGSSAPELVNNNWGTGQAATTGSPSPPLAIGTYRIRIQYEERNGGNQMYLLWDDTGNSAGPVAGQTVAASGVLSSMSDVDIFAVNLVPGSRYSFRLDPTAETAARQDRYLAVLSEFGQPLAHSPTGDQVNIDIHQSAGGRHFIAVRAAQPSGLGGYAVSAEGTGNFPTQRDVPLYYFDFDGTGTYFGWQAAPFPRPDLEPLVMHMYEAQLGVNDIDLTTIAPPSGAERVGNAVGDVPSPPWGGLGGGGRGNRRPSGNAINDVGGAANWNNLNDGAWAFGVTRHEGGHGTGIPHLRHPLDVMSYDGQLKWFTVGQMFPFDENPLPQRRLFRQRDYLDWATQAGRIVPELEANEAIAAAQDLDPYLSEMTGDADPRNDKAVVVAAISNTADLDTFHFTATAGERWAFDIDSAEFQHPLDATVTLFDSAGNQLAQNTESTDWETGFDSVDPYLAFTFATAGSYYVQVTPAGGTVGNYRLKVSPERSWETQGPRVLASWPNGGQTINGTRQLTFWMNEQLDPETLGSANIEVRNQNNVVQPGTAWFDTPDAVLVWNAESQLAPGSYTVTLRGTGTPITDLYGNALDGDTSGTPSWPQVSGDGTPGGDYITTFTINAVDSAAAFVNQSSYRRHAYNYGLFELRFNDEINIRELFDSPDLTLRKDGSDGQFGTADDVIVPYHLAVDKIRSTEVPHVYVYTFGVPESGVYQIEGTLQDASGLTLSVSEQFFVGTSTVATDFLQTTSFSDNGLTGSYVNQSLRGTSSQADWRVSQSISGSRVDPAIDFDASADFGSRAEVGITSGTDANWENFSVQWDGWITIPSDGIHLATRSDDGSRMWIDLNDDGAFNTSGPEYINNGWGAGQAATIGPSSVGVPTGTYRIRVQYEEGNGGNSMQLLWDYEGSDIASGAIVRPTNVAKLNIQPGTTLQSPLSAVEITFSGSLDTNTLTTANFQLRYSADPTFFDGNDSLIADADGQISWDPTRNLATLEPASMLGSGYYLIELDGNPGGLTDRFGRLLDGEFLDAGILGNTSESLWKLSPSGDGLPGGDYRAMFAVQAAPAQAAVVARRIFYNNSYFDDPLRGFDDNRAIAPTPTEVDGSECNAALDCGKSALLPGQTASFQNYTTYAKGINGTIVDIDGLPGTITAADFDFRVGNSNTPGDWNEAPTPISITVHEGEGAGGSDRIKIIWSDGSIVGQWLQVTVLDTVNTGLAVPDIHYWGNAPGESGDGVPQINATDFASVRGNSRTFLNRATIENALDFNRDSLVNAADLIVVRDHAMNLLANLTLITAPGASPSPFQSPAIGAKQANTFDVIAPTPHHRPDEFVAEGIPTSDSRAYFPAWSFGAMKQSLEPNVRTGKHPELIRSSVDAIVDNDTMLASLLATIDAACPANEAVAGRTDGRLPIQLSYSDSNDILLDLLANDLMSIAHGVDRINGLGPFAI